MVASNTGNKSGNNIEAVLCRLAAEVAYVQKRLCVRNSAKPVQLHLQNAADYVELAIQCAEGKNDS